MSVVLSFSYNGHHCKSKGVVLDPIQHLQMLIAAIDCANPNGKHNVIVSAIGLDPWSMSLPERKYALEVYKRSTAVLSKNSNLGHQDGAATAIRMATEYSSVAGIEYMIHMAEDVMMAPDFVDYFVRQLADADYVGSHWIMKGIEKRPYSLNTQVFGCRPDKFADMKKELFVMPFYVKEIEIEMLSRIKGMGLRWKVGATPENLLLYPEGRTIPYPESRGDGPTLYEHTHDPAIFRQWTEARGVKWFELPKSNRRILL